MPKERYISPGERQEIVDEQRLNQYNNEISKIINLNDNIIADAVAKSYAVEL